MFVYHTINNNYRKIFYPVKKKFAIHNRIHLFNFYELSYFIRTYFSTFHGYYPSFVAEFNGIRDTRTYKIFRTL